MHAQGADPSVQEVLVLRDGIGLYHAGKYLYYLEDSERELSFGDILDADVSGKLLHSQQEFPNFKNYNANLWLKLTVENPDSLINDWLFEIDHPPMDEIEFFYKDWKGEWKSKLLGDKLPFNKREVAARTYVLPISFLKKKQTYFFRIQTSGGIRVPLKVMRAPYYYERSNRKETLYGMYYGILVLMMFYNLVVFFFFRRKSYLYYAIVLFAAELYFATIYGHAYQFLWPWSPWLNNKAGFFAITLWAASSALFTRHFLETDSYEPYLSRMLTYYAVANGLLFFITGIVGSEVHPVFFVCIVLDVLLCCLLLLVTGIICLRKGSYAVRYFVVAWGIYLLAIAVAGLRNAGVFPDMPQINTSTDIATIIQVTILAVALVDKYQRISREKDKVQAEALRIQVEANDQLEEKVKKRTQEIARQKEIIEKKNLDITDSISYARRIQTAMLPYKKHIDAVLPEHFILFKPREVVSGDFYWFAHKNGKTIITAIDCTGHGVPGALMSMIGNDLLNYIVIERQILRPDHILNALHKGVRHALHQDENESSDGMDMALCVIDREAGTLEYAGAKNPLYIVQPDRHGTPVFKEIKGDRIPIGGQQFDFEEERCFSRHILDITRPTVFYMASDGFQDQFGGSENKKFMAKRLRELLFSIHHEPMEVQKNRLEATFEVWKEGSHQLDDVLVIGVRLELE